MQYFILLFSLFIIGCTVRVYEPGMNSFEACSSMCYSKGQNYSEVLQCSMGTCICDNEEGRKVAEGYHMYLNNQCNEPEEDRD